MTNKKTLGLAVLVLVLASVLAACGASGDFAAEAPMPQEVHVEKVMVESEVAEGYAPDVSNTGTSANQTQVVRMIIWNANISLTVEDTQESVTAVQNLARDMGGYTIASESWLSDDQLVAQVTIRLPAERFEEAMAQLRDLGLEVNRESSSSEDVTDQYVDLESRLRHLEAKETQLIDFLAEAEDTEAALLVYEHLAETQAEIEQVKGRMAYLEKLSAMATISVELYPEEAEPPVIEEGWNPGTTLRNAARALVSTLEMLANAAIWVAIYLLPVLLLVALPVAIVVWLVRRRRKGHQKRDEPANE